MTDVPGNVRKILLQLLQQVHDAAVQGEEYDLRAAAERFVRSPGLRAALEVEGDASAWYLRVLDEPVHHTTDQPVDTLAIDWTRDGRMVGIEILPGREEDVTIEWGTRCPDGAVARYSEAEARDWCAAEAARALVQRTCGPWREVVDPADESLSDDAVQVAVIALRQRFL